MKSSTEEFYLRIQFKALATAPEGVYALDQNGRVWRYAYAHDHYMSSRNSWALVEHEPSECPKDWLAVAGCGCTWCHGKW